jgi:hypothetical protein
MGKDLSSWWTAGTPDDKTEPPAEELARAAYFDHW